MAFLRKHKAVIGDFFRRQLITTIGYTLTTAALIAAFLFSGLMEHESLRWTGLIVLLLAVLLIARAISVYIMAPPKYAEQVQTLSDEEQEKLLSEYPSAKKVGQHRYMDKLMVFFTRTRIFVVRYEDITGVEAGKRDLLLNIKDRETPLHLPCPSRNVGPVVFAFLRSKNPDIKIIRKETSV